MFSHRHYQRELIDGDEIPDADLQVNLDELHLVNKFLGGYAISKSAMKRIQIHDGTVVDIGCGGGHMLRELFRWSHRRGLHIKLAGLDIKSSCIDRSKSVCADTDVVFVLSDYKLVFKAIPDTRVVHACLFTHHLGNREIIDLIRLCMQNKAILVVNDLVRHPLAYYSIKWLTKMFSNSYLVKNDAPLSVLRGFKKKEWKAILEDAGAVDYTIQSRWAFRHLIVVYG